MNQKFENIWSCLKIEIAIMGAIIFLPYMLAAVS